MPVVATCPICKSDFSSTKWAIETRHRVTCSPGCSKEWRKIFSANKRKPIGRCRAFNCNYCGPLDIKKYCRRHFNYFLKHGYSDIPDHSAQPIQIEEKWALWLAGVIDCEGWIGFFKATRRNGAVYWAVIAVGNTNRILIDKISNLTGIGKVSFIERPKPAKHIHKWTVSRINDVRAVLLAIRPHLILKAQQADLILSLPPPNTKAGDIRHEISMKMKELNKKGR